MLNVEDYSNWKCSKAHEQLLADMQKLGYSTSMRYLPKSVYYAVALMQDKMDGIDFIALIEELYGERKRLEELEGKYRDKLCKLSITERDISLKKAEVQKMIDELEESKKQAIKEVSELNSAIYKCETPEARDKIRLADFFESKVEVISEYDRTAYIKGLGAILGGDKNIATAKITADGE